MIPDNIYFWFYRNFPTQVRWIERKKLQYKVKQSIKKEESYSEKDIKNLINFGYLTVGKLKQILKENCFDDNTLIVSQRVKDVYFEKHNWKKFELVDNWSLIISEYSPVWGPVYFPKKKNKILYLDLHY